jgi:hypothetical protein
VESRLDIEPGMRLLNRYEVTRVLGRGGSGEALLARDTLVGITVVCKIGLIPEPMTWTTFIAQLAKLRRIRSRDVVQAFDLHEYRTEAGERLPLLVLEAVEGTDLIDWHPTRGLADKIVTCARVAEALALLHEQEMTHGDLSKGVNILSGGDRVVLIDPEPEVWGSSSGSGERLGDLESLAQILEIMIPEHARLGLDPLINDLRKRGTGVGARGVAAILRPLSARLPLKDASDIEAAAKSYHATYDAIDARYIENRKIRSLAIATLAERLRALCVPFKFDVKVDDGMAEQTEPHYDNKPTGFFTRRVLTCTSQRQKLSWIFQFESNEHFYKPFPFFDREVLAEGRIVAIGMGGALETHKLSLRKGPTGWDVFASAMPPRGRPRPKEESAQWVTITDDWLAEQFAALVGLPT